VYTSKLPRKIGPYLRKITEAWFRARALGIDLVHHTHDSRRNVPSFPDLVLCKPAAAGDASGRLIFANREPGARKEALARSVWGPARA
jgi:hypothetical protein